MEWGELAREFDFELYQELMEDGVIEVEEEEVEEGIHILTINPKK